MCPSYWKDFCNCDTIKNIEYSRNWSKEKERIEKAKEEKAADKKAAEKKEQKKAENEIGSKSTTVSADSMDELIQKMNSVDWTKISPYMGESKLNLTV